MYEELQSDTNGEFLLSVLENGYPGLKKHTNDQLFAELEQAGLLDEYIKEASPHNEENPYALFFESKKEESLKVTTQIHNLIESIKKLPSEEEVKEVARKIKKLRKAGVGVGDTDTDECIASVFENYLEVITRAGDCKISSLVDTFYHELH
jgi:hypothetical protein